MVEKPEAELTAYCGLYCGDCIRYRSRASDLSRELLQELDATEFEQYARIKSSPEKQLDAVKQFRYYNECREMLKAIEALQCNTPCREGEGCSSFSCGILACCREKGIQGCWLCDKYPDCEKLSALYSIHGDCVQQNLGMIKKHGIDNWTSYRSKPYIWQE